MKRSFLIPFVVVIMLFLAQLACVPQDCMGVTFNIKGYVVDSAGNPISSVRIRAFNHGSFEKPPFDVEATSDQSGYFETEYVFSYACTPFEIEISAEGYQLQTLTHEPPGEQWPNELPDNLSITMQKQ